MKSPIEASKSASFVRRFNRTLAVLALGMSCLAQAQKPPGALPDAPDPSQSEDSLRRLPLNILKDQGAIWTSPARLRESNAVVPLALVLATGLTMTADHQAMSSSRLKDPSLNSHAVTASNGLVGGFIAAPVVFYGFGVLQRNDHFRETGVLGAEAILDSLVVNEATKIISRRERPGVDEARGRFFQPNVGFDSSFASNHSVIAWSTAAVIASEYNGPLTKLTAYGLATGVSVTRVIGREHFPSDVLAASAVGWLIGRYVVHRHRHSY